MWSRTTGLMVILALGLLAAPLLANAQEPWLKKLPTEGAIGSLS